jgi:hypothetical protein
MKKKLQILFSLIPALLYSELSYSQWSGLSNPAGNGDIIYTTSTVTGIGVGTFAGNLGAVLHVNSNLATAQTGSGAFAKSEIFRTQVPSSTASYWRMFRGSDEMANFWFGTTANSLNLNSSRGAFRIASGNTSGTLNEAFEIVGGTGSDKGWIGI